MKALEKIKQMLNDVQYASKVPSVDNEIAEIEKELLALEIIKNNLKIRIDFVLEMPTYADYCNFAYDFMMISEFEYNILREVFKNE